MHTTERVSKAITDARFGHRGLAADPAASRLLGGLDMLSDLLWQPGDRDQSTLALYEEMAKACDDELQLIAERLECAALAKPHEPNNEEEQAMTATDNARRVTSALEAILAFQTATGAADDDALADLLTDLMHWADDRGEDFAAALGRARMHHGAKCGEGV